MITASIPGYSVSKAKDGLYSVKVKGNKEGIVLNEPLLRQFAAQNGGYVKEESKGKKIAKVIGVIGGLAAITAGVIYRKDIAKAAKALDTKISSKFDYKGFIKNSGKMAKEYFNAGIDKTKSFIDNLYSGTKATLANIKDLAVDCSKKIVGESKVLFSQVKSILKGSAVKK